MCATLAGTPSLSARRKSITRYARLCPPPWCRAVTLPWTLRPPRPCSGRTSDFSGWSRVTSAKSATLEPRRPGVVGLYLRIAMGRESLSVLSGPVGGGRGWWAGSRSRPSGARAAEDLDAVAGGDGDDGALGVLALAHLRAPAALALALAVDRVHAEDLDVKDLLDRDLDLRIVGLGQHDERVLVAVQQPVALLGDDRGEQDVPGVADAHAFSSVVSSTVPSPAAGAMDGTTPGISWVERSGRTAPERLPFAGPATYSASAVSVKTTSSDTSTSYVLSWPASIRCTCGRLRRLTQLRTSSWSRTTRTFFAEVIAFSVASADLVRGASPSTNADTTCTRPSRARSERAPRRAAAFIFFGVFLL